MDSHRGETCLFDAERGPVIQPPSRIAATSHRPNTVDYHSRSGPPAQRGSRRSTEVRGRGLTGQGRTTAPRLPTRHGQSPFGPTALMSPSGPHPHPATDVFRGRTPSNDASQHRTPRDKLPITSSLTGANLRTAGFRTCHHPTRDFEQCERVLARRSPGRPQGSYGASHCSPRPLSRCVPLGPFDRFASMLAPQCPHTTRDTINDSVTSCTCVQPSRGWKRRRL